MERKDRFLSLLVEFPGDIAGRDPDDLDRFALVERSRYGERYITDHDSAEDAADYHDNQDYAEDWTIEVLVDLDTGERFSADTKATFVSTFEPSPLTEMSPPA